MLNFRWNTAFDAEIGAKNQTQKGSTHCSLTDRQKQYANTVVG